MVEYVPTSDAPLMTEAQGHFKCLCDLPVLRYCTKLSSANPKTYHIMVLENRPRYEFYLQVFTDSCVNLIELVILYFES